MSDMKEKVETRIANMLALVIADDVDQESYDFVLGKLTKLAMLGTAPANCTPKGKGCTVPGCKKQAKRNAKRKSNLPDIENFAVGESDNASQREDAMPPDDFASLKEAFIAP